MDQLQTAKSRQLLETKAKSKWRLIQNLIKSVKLLQQPEVIQITSQEELQNNIQIDTNQTNQKDKVVLHKQSLQRIIDHGFRPQGFKIYYKVQNTSNDFDMMLNQQRNLKIFYEFVQRGTEKDIENVEFFLRKDPKQHLYPKGSHFLICNQQDQNGKLPLYIACTSGNLNMIKTLIKMGSDPNLQSIIYLVLTLQKA